MASACFMGIPATGAIARSATNVKAKAYSPVSGIMQSVFILLFMLLLSPAAQYIPLACLSSVLIIIAYNMFNFPKFWHLLQGPRGDRITLIVTFLLTVMVDLNTAISVGFIMSSVIFMHRMSREIEVANDESVLEYVSRGQDISDTLNEKRCHLAAFVWSVVFRRGFASLNVFPPNARCAESPDFPHGFGSGRRCQRRQYSG